MEDQIRTRFLDRTTPPHILTLTLITGLSALSMNIFLPSLPGMTAYFEADYRLMQLSIALYLAMNAVLQVLVGPISDRYGRRPVLLVSFAIFVIASLGCVFAPTAEIFLAFRMVQAAVSVGMVLSRAVVRDMVPADKAASMIAYVTMGMAVVPMLAPMVGGLLDAAFGWQANFWLLFILGALVTWLLWHDLGETAARRSGGLRAQIAEYPELLTSPRFWGYSAVAMFASGAFFAYLGGAPFVGTEIHHLDPARLGLFFGAPALGYLVGNGVAGRYSARFGIDRMILIGTLVPTTCLIISLLLHLAGFTHPLIFFGLMIPFGFGNGMVMPNATSGTLSVRPQLAGSASGLGGAMMIGGGAALSALSGMVLSVETGPWPLLALMLTSSFLSVVSILLVMRRAARVGAV
ncbi:multidrug effflux MFS transporter [Sinisalibacter aestuarii]|uniref:Bcr/CflA family efflux transporter n=1 Tax=Sinisalibacter aestuarii TaxID=2949426 RepID=A0ABQ5LU97_9RHOB|nr:multidrug effflux MFS transporter [Sinisalibacter aestuarii]GKY88348.1 Bcr/CflA family drug resistance efflux transporter [Sinisalibacter aestuarii]